MVKVIDKIWFTNPRGAVGILIGEDDITGKRKAYIGSVLGLDEDADTGSILRWGNKLNMAVVDRIINGLDPKGLHKK